MPKPFATILEPDERFRAFVKFDDLQPLTLADHHRGINAIVLNATTPKNVCTVFERARCAFLYAWYAYELTTLAQGQALSALELALSQHLEARYPGKVFSALNTCLEKSIADGDFDGMSFHADEPPRDRVRLHHLRELLVYVRNDIAHGTEMVVTPSDALDLIGYCARLINRLHPS